MKEAPVFVVLAFPGSPANPGMSSHDRIYSATEEMGHACSSYDRKEPHLALSRWFNLTSKPGVESGTGNAKGLGCMGLIAIQPD